MRKNDLTTRLLTTEVAREIYLSNLADIEDLLERWRYGKLTDEGERQAVWIHLDQTVRAVARRHFRQRQVPRRKDWYDIDKDEKEYDQHLDRIFQLAEFLLSDRFRYDNVAKVITAYKRRFAQLEALRTCRLTYGRVNLPLVLKTWYDTEEEAGRVPSEQREANFLIKYRHHLYLRSLANPCELHEFHRSSGVVREGGGLFLEDTV